MTNSQVLKRYAVVTLITMVALIVISIALSAMAGYDIGGGAGIVSVLVPAMDAGAAYVRNTNQLMDKPRMWRLAIWFALINFAMGVMMFVGISVALGENLAPVITQISMITLLVIMLVVGAVYILAGRFFLGFGARQELTRQEKMRG